MSLNDDFELFALSGANGQMWEIHKRGCSTIPIKNARVIKTDPKILAQMDSESIQKSAEQQKNEVGVMVHAREMIAGPSYEKGKTLTKKRR
jgi:hypothetical protein